MTIHRSQRSPFGLRAAVLCLLTTISACGLATDDADEIARLTSAAGGSQPQGVLLNEGGSQPQGDVLNEGGSQPQGDVLNSGGSQPQGDLLNTGGSQPQGPALQGGLRTDGHLYEGATIDGTPVGTLRIEGGELLAERDGITLRGLALEGLEVLARVVDESSSPATERLELHRVSAVRQAPFGEGESFLYRVERQSPAGSWQPLCAPTATGETEAVPVAATWNGRADRVESTSAFTFACTSGAIGKCYSWGYRPWEAHPEGPALARDAHQACVRLARADYCGDGRAHTKTGTIIIVWDTLTDGPQDWERIKGMHFEAAWTPSGAKCVDHPRWHRPGDVREIRCGDRVIPTCTDTDRAASLGPVVGAPRMFTESRSNLDLGRIDPRARSRVVAAARL